MRVFYKPLSFVTLKLKTSCKFSSHLSPSCFTFSLPAFSVPVSLHMQDLFFTEPLPTHSSHLGINKVISLHFLQVLPKHRLFPRPSDCSLLRKASIMPHTQWHWRSITHPARVVSILHHCWEGASASAPCPHTQPMQRKAFMGFTICELSGNQASCHCELPTSLSCCRHRAVLPGTAKQQRCSGTVIAEDGCEAFSRVKKTLLLWGLAGRTVLSLWPRSVTFGGNISSSRWETLPNTHKTEAALSPLGTTPSLLHAKGTVWNKEANEPSCSWQCYHWGCSHKATVKLAGQRGMRKNELLSRVPALPKEPV